MLKIIFPILLLLAAPAFACLTGEAHYEAARKGLVPCCEQLSVADGAGAVKIPQLLRLIEHLELSMPNGNFLVKRFQGEGLESVQSVFDAIVTMRRNAASKLADYADFAGQGNSKDAALALASAAKEMAFTKPAKDQADLEGRERFEAKQWNIIKLTLKGIGAESFSYNNPAHRELINMVGGKIAGVWGEVGVGLRLSNIEGIGVGAETLPGSRRLSRNLRDREIDIIYSRSNQRRVWAEVKNIAPLDHLGDYFVEKLLPQLQAQKQLRDELGLERSVDLELWLINGATPEAIRLISAEGFTVRF